MLRSQRVKLRLHHRELCFTELVLCALCTQACNFRVQFRESRVVLFTLHLCDFIIGGLLPLSLEILLTCEIVFHSREFLSRDA